MKTKIGICFLVLLMILLLAAAAQADGFLDFEGGIEGFLKSGSCQLVQSSTAYSGAYSLGVQARGQNDYDAADYPMASLGIKQGDTVTLSFYAYHEGEKAGIIKAGLGGGSYAELARATVEPKTWTQITGTFTVTELGNIRFQTYGSNMNGVSFYVDDIKVSVLKTEAPAEDHFKDYFGSFEDGGLDGWFPRSSGKAEAAVSKEAAHSGTQSLQTTGRSDNWNSPGRSFSFTAGKTYEVSCFVRQDSGKSVEFILSAVFTRGGQDSYVNLNRKTALTGEWVELSASFAAGPGVENTVLYVETANAPELSFFMDDFSVTKKGQIYRSDLPSLKEKYKDNFLMGCAVGQSQSVSSERMDFLASQFNSFTTENELKPENVFDAQKSRALALAGDNTHPVVKFDTAKPLLDFAKANGIAVHGHVLVWHSQTPRSFFTEDYTEDGTLAGRDMMLLRLENYIAAVMKYLDENYKGVVLSWDVVNEAILDGSGKLRGKKTLDEKNGTYWMDTVGEDYILQAFALASKYAPEGTKLFYNDYSVPYEPKLTGIKAVMDELMAAYVVDGIGFQGHYQLNTPSVRQISDAMAYFAGLGLSIRVSELDITIPVNTPAALLNQAKRYQSLMEVFLGFQENIDAVTVWGTSDDLSWKSEGFPLLFDKDMTPKSAFWAWADPSKLPSNEQKDDDGRPSGTLNKPNAEAAFGEPDMSGSALDPLWETAPGFPMTATRSQNADEDGKVKASFRALWQPDTLYVLVYVTDPHLDDSNANTYMQDSIEVFVDEGNNRTGFYEEDDGQYRVNFKNLLTIDHGTVMPVSRAFATENGFVAEIAIPFTASVSQGDVLGFDVRYNNAAADGRRTLLNFSDDSDTGWNDTTVFGLLELK